MAQRIINESILVVRNGKRVAPAIGKAFDLTEQEIADLERIRPQAISALTQLVVDPQSTPTPDVQDAPAMGDYAAMTKDQLTQLAESMGIDVPARATKDKLIELITTADGSEDL